jgi:hypothetical protein
MFKNVLLAGALLVPVLAYGASPSTDLSVQIVPAASPTPPPAPTPPPSPNGIACDIGPNYTGTIPAGAQAAGFTHCAANYDFTQPFFATMSNWLDCAGASSPLWYNTGYNSTATPCSDFSIVNDSGSNVLEIQWTPTDASNNSSASWMGTTPSNTSSGNGTFPQGVYVQDIWRSTAATQTALGVYGDILSFFTWSGANNGIIEWDWFEAYTDGGAANCYHDWDNNGGGCGGNFWATGTNFSPSAEAAYHTYASRVTSDGSANFALCTYLDGSQLGCNEFQPGSSNAFGDRNYYSTGVGNLNAGSVTVPSVPEVMYIKQITVFSCSGWQTGQCNGTVLDGSP